MAQGDAIDATPLAPESLPMSAAISAGIASLAPRYDVYIVDLWGTLHDGELPHADAVAALHRLKQERKCIAVLSNAPRRAAEVAASMTRMGIPPSCYDCLWSSGEEAWQALATRSDEWYRRLGRRGYHLGPQRDRGMLDNPGLDACSDIGDADFVLCTGLDRPEETVEDYRGVLAAAARRGLPMICANPDLEVLRGEQREWCAGALAVAYERELAGEVRWHGKPHASVFHACLRQCAAGDGARALVIGDSLRTDIAGAHNSGLHAAFVVGGIHLAELELAWGDPPDGNALARLYARTGVTPDWTLPTLRW